MKNRKLKVTYSGDLQVYWRWRILFALVLIVMTALNFGVSSRAGLISLIFSTIYILLVVGIYFLYKSRIMKGLVSFATRYGQIQKEMLKGFEIPVALLEPNGKVLWMNDTLCELTGKQEGYDKNISGMFPEIGKGALPSGGWDNEVYLQYQGEDYRVHIRKTIINELVDEVDIVDRDADYDCFLYMAYFFNETLLNRYIAENKEQKPVVGLIYLDNFDDVMERSEDVHQSLLTVLVDRKINKYMNSMECLVKKLEKDKYLIVMNRKSLDALVEDRFSILEGVKTINIGNDVSITISIGLGVNGRGYIQNQEFARSAIEMALGRGGDQVVVKDNDNMSFYGGKSQHNERNTQVKSRVKAQAMQEIISASDNVVVMGHTFTDMDCLGASIGVYRAAVTLGKPAHIVLGEVNSTLRTWISQFKESKDYDEEMFISHEKARELVNNNTVVVVVDTNRPSLTECREILSLTNTVVVLDHHRQTTEKIENASLSYIEPSASSACEMIAEILQYFEETVKLKGLEADSMYAGIIIDTNNFVAKTGVRTFEAAAYLRRCGADVTRVRKALRDDIDSYKAKAETVRLAENYMDCYAISICPAEGLESPNVVCAQAANDLLDIEGVRASFVMTEYDNRIFISARSIDEVNVQIIMERLGGGGHGNIAGAQLEQVTAQEAVERVKAVLKDMTEEGAI